MQIVKFDVELTGSKDVLLNGVNALADRALPVFEEKVFEKQFTAEQQFAVMCMTRRLAEQVWSAYQKGRVIRGEISDDDYKRLVL